MNKYLIVPGCSDLNRGDQALVWETRKLMEESGFLGEYYLTSEQNEPVIQSIEKGFKVVIPILEHPSRKFKKKDNINYSLSLKIKWGTVAFFDLIISLMIFIKPFRQIIKKFVSAEKRHSIKVIENVDAVIMKGGGLLQTYGGLSSTYSMFFWVYPLLLAHVLRKPVYIMPNSFGPFKGPLVKWIAKLALNKSKMVLCRENLSKDLLKQELNIEAKTTADLAFYLKTHSTLKEDILKLYNLPTDRKIVAITVRPYRFPGIQNPEKAYKKYKSDIAAFAEWLYDNGYMPAFVEHTLAINEHEDDGKCIKGILEILDSSKYRFISDDNLDCIDLKTIYSYFDYIIGTRFHSVIFSFGTGVPGIAISYIGNKAIGIMNDIGLSEFVVKIEDVSFELLKNLFIKLNYNENLIREKISIYNNRSKIERNEIIEEIKRTRE